MPLPNISYDHRIPQLPTNPLPQYCFKCSCILTVAGNTIIAYRNKVIFVARMIYTVRSDGLSNNPVLSHPLLLRASQCHMQKFWQNNCRCKEFKEMQQRLSNLLKRSFTYNGRSVLRATYNQHEGSYQLIPFHPTMLKRFLKFNPTISRLL